MFDVWQLPPGSAPGDQVTPRFSGWAWIYPRFAIQPFAVNVSVSGGGQEHTDALLSYWRGPRHQWHPTLAQLAMEAMVRRILMAKGFASLYVMTRAIQGSITALAWSVLLLVCEFSFQRYIRNASCGVCVGRIVG